jgi:hypothetical protein
MKVYHFLLTIVACAPFLLTTTQAQNAQSNIKPLIDAQRYVFEAQFAVPMSGRTRTLTSLYTLTVSKDSVIADLPYFGKANFAPLDPTNEGITFTSTNFDYTVNRTKKAWNITIKPRDISDGNQLFFTVFDNGSASLQVTSNTRDGISFNGFIRARKQ